jgi:hypothetical protein
LNEKKDPGREWKIVKRLQTLEVFPFIQAVTSQAVFLNRSERGGEKHLSFDLADQQEKTVLNNGIRFFP